MTMEELLKTESLIEWLSTKPSDEKYNYFNEPRCAISEYFFENGHPELVATPNSIVRKQESGVWETVMNTLPVGWNAAASGYPKEMVEPVIPERTYGAMLKRLTDGS